MSRPLRPGEPCLLIDGRGRRYLLELSEAGEFHSHLGMLAHRQLIGREEGFRVITSKGHALLVLRPRLADYILKMRRGAQVVYPKDIGPILVFADIAPGAVVVEGGTGSGALTMALSRAVGTTGRVVTVEQRADHLEQARRAIRGFFGEIPSNLELRSGRVEDVVAEVGPDRVVLDVPEPWLVAETAAGSLPAGGIICVYLPTIPQVQRTIEALRKAGAFAEIMTMEVLVRTWNVDGPSVRPDHRMVGHTGFLTIARRVTPP